jgi:antitoxin component of RelBE/YafQ-DinJ toxin-antitoxin module
MSASVTLHIRVPPDMKTQIQEAAKKLGMSENDATRLILSVGLAQLKRINYELPEAIIQHGTKRAPKKRSKE